MNLRKTTSLTTLLSFILLLFTSVILYITPQGKIAFWANWKMLGLDKEQWGALHTNIGILFVVAGVIHTLVNMKAIISYLKNKAQKIRVFTMDFNVALVVTLLVTLFTLFELSPVHAVQEYNHSLKETAAEKYGEPPYGHAESSSLQSFCRRTGLDLQKALERLEQAGYSEISAGSTLTEISEANGVSPQQVYDRITPEAPQQREVDPSSGSGRGFGKKTVSAVCAEYGLNVNEAISELKNAGIEAFAEDTIRAVAEKNGTEPSALREAIRQLQ